jgi:hypothetical protein
MKTLIEQMAKNNAIVTASFQNAGANLLTEIEPKIKAVQEDLKRIMLPHFNELIRISREFNDQQPKP